MHMIFRLPSVKFFGKLGLCTRRCVPSYSISFLPVCSVGLECEPREPSVSHELKFHAQWNDVTLPRSINDVIRATVQKSLSCEGSGFWCNPLGAIDPNIIKAAHPWCEVLVRISAHYYINKCLGHH